MLFKDFSNPSKDLLMGSLYRKKQCASCPLRASKKFEDTPKAPGPEVLVWSNRTNRLVTHNTTQVPTHHEFLVECSGESSDVVQECCFGRKLDSLIQIKPKVLIVEGYSAFKQVEEALGMPNPANQPFRFLYPSEYMGHRFWLLPLETLTDLHAVYTDLQMALRTPPEVVVPTLRDINLVTNTRDLKEAFDYLGKQSVCAMDIETASDHPDKDMRFRPYHSSARLLSMAISGGSQTFAFPIRHRQTPRTNYDVQAFVDSFLNLLTGLDRMVAHNLSFELEWLAWFFGIQLPYLTRYDDTMAASDLLIRGGMSLNLCARRELGINLKDMSKVPVDDLDNQDLNDVLTYNGGDSKYTLQLFYRYLDQINRRNLSTIYDMQCERISSTVVMQIKGLVPNPEFLDKECQEREHNLARMTNALKQSPNVRKFLLTNNDFNPMSSDDVKSLHYLMGVSRDITSFKESVIETFPYPESKAILEIRKENKLISNYLAPLCLTSKHKSAGSCVWSDGLIHPRYKAVGIITGRYSASDPSAQNYPSHDGMKYIRNGVRALPGWVFFSADYGQLEYRIIATLTEDPVMIKSILDGLDVHAHWARYLINRYPGLFIPENSPTHCEKKANPDFRGNCPCGACRFSAFRGAVKNQMIFPLCYGSSIHNVGPNLGIPKGDCKSVGDDFWSRHGAVKKWHERLDRQMKTKGYVVNAFGRPYYPPLLYTEQINYPVQGTASDLVVRNQAYLSRLAVETDRLYLAPIGNEHDNLLFMLPDEPEVLAEAVPTIIKGMLYTKDLSFCKVPMLIEAEMGYTWGGLKKFGAFEGGKIDF